MRVVKAPSIQFKCSSCSAVCEGEVYEFQDLHTTPPSFRAKCAFCNCFTTVFNSVLTARCVGEIAEFLQVESIRTIMES